MRERIPDLAIEIRRRPIQRVIDGVLRELEPRHVVAEERFDISAFEIPAKVRTRAIEHARHRKADAVSGHALEITDDIEAECDLERLRCRLGLATAQRELARDTPAAGFDRGLESRREQR